MMANKIKKTLSLLIAMAMVFTALPMGAFAEAGSHAQIVSTGGTKYYDAAGAEITAADKQATAPVTVSKTIAGTNTENEFDITLEVTTRDESQTVTTTPNAALVLVVDTSNSMKWCSKCGEELTDSTHTATPAQEAKYAYYCTDGYYYTFSDWDGDGYCDNDGIHWSYGKTLAAHRKVLIQPAQPAIPAVCSGTTSRMTEAKLAAETLVNKFGTETKAKPGEHRWVQIVVFDSNAETLTTRWYDAATAAGREALCGTATTNGLIDGITPAMCGAAHDNDPAGGTNIEGGLMLANNVIDAGQKAGKPLNGLTHVFSALLTDGAPTYYVNSTSSSTSAITGYKGGGNEPKKTDVIDVPAQANALKAQTENAKFFSICYGETRNSDGTYSSVAAEKPFSNYSNLNFPKNDTTIESWMTSFSSAFYKANDNAALFTSITEIIGSINISAQSQTVVDPMGAFIVKGAESTTGNSSTFENNKINWNLSNSTPVSSTANSKTYRYTYRVTLDTAADGFPENTAIPTNGTTTLTYQYGANGTPVTVNFPIPTVKGEYPTYQYTVKYYKQSRPLAGETEKQYTLADTSAPINAKLHSRVTPPAGYETKYAGDNFTSAGGDTTMVISENNMVMELYYDLIPATVEVKHYSRTLTEVDGEVTNPEEPYAYQSSDTPTGYYQGDKFTATTRTDLGAIDTAASAYTDVTVSGTSLVIKIYYTKTTASRTPVGYSAAYFYREKSWQLVGGKYELVTGSYSEDASKAESQGAATSDKYLGDTYTAPAKPDGYTFVEAKPSATITLGANAAGNRVEMYYEKTAEDTRDSATLQIVHHYTETLVSGTKSYADLYTYTTPLTVYVGEIYTFNKADVAKTDAHGGGWTCTVSAQISKDIAAGENVIELYYTRDGRVTTDVLVQETLITYKWVVDASGNKGLTVDSTDSKTPYAMAGTFYVGGESNQAEIKNYDGFSFIESESTANRKLTNLGTTGTNTITMVYHKLPADLAEAYATVKHVFTTYRSYVDANGVVQKNVSSTETVADPDGKQTGSAGEWFMATPDAALAAGSYTDWTVKTTNLKVYYSSSDEDYTFYINYERTQDDLTGNEASFTVLPVYVTYSREINAAGEEVVVEKSRVNGTEWSDSTQTYYVGQKVSVTPTNWEQDGFKFDSKDAANTAYQNVELVKSPAKQIVLVYSKTEDNRGELYTVTWKYHDKYTSTEIVDGERKSIVTEGDRTGGSVQLYKGQKFDPTAKYSPLSTEYSLVLSKSQNAKTVFTVAGDTEVLFWYEGSRDQTVPATVTVIHHYKVTDLANPASPTETNKTVGPVSKYVGQSYTAAKDGNGIFTEAEMADDKITVTATVGEKNAVAPSGLTIEIDAKAEQIDIYYEKTVDTRVSTNVKVVHEYYTRDTFYTEREDAFVGKFEQTFSGRENGVYVGAAYTAALRLSHNEQKYSFASATPANYKIDSLGATGENVITIKYIREVDGRTGTDVVVNHVYETYDSYTQYYSEDSRTSETIAAKDAGGNWVLWEGKSFTANLKETSGYAYNASRSDALTIASLGEAGSNVITIKYVKTTDSTPSYWVRYEWTDAPASGVTLPTGTESIREGSPFTVDTVYAAGKTVRGVKDGVSGTYTFSGWKNGETVAVDFKVSGNTTLTGVWSFTADAPVNPSVTRYTITVNYLDQDTGKAIHTPYSVTVREGRAYDVTAQDAIAIDGYTYVKTEGSLTGAANGNKTVNVWYTAKQVEPEPPVDIEDGEVPGGDKPDVPTEPSEPEVPTEPGEDIVIVDDETPLGNLPNTGIAAQPVDPVVTLGLLALTFSMAAAGLGFAQNGRRKEEEEENK